MKVYSANHDATGMRIALCAARFNRAVTEQLVEGARRELLQRGARAEDLHLAWVPGAFEIPQAARALAQTRRYDAVVALGAVIRGETPHFQYVCESAAAGVQNAMRETGCPVAFGVLTCETAQQARARAGGEQGNKGAEAASVAIEMAHLLRAIEHAPPLPAMGEVAKTAAGGAAGGGDKTSAAQPVQHARAAQAPS